MGVSVDRHAAQSFKEKNRVDTHATYTLFGQVFQQVNKIEPAKLRNNKQPLNFGNADIAKIQTTLTQSNALLNK